MITCPSLLQFNQSIYFLILTIIACTSPFLNGYAVFCILFRSKNHMTFYKWLLLKHQLLGFTLDIVVRYFLKKQQISDEYLHQTNFGSAFSWRLQHGHLPFLNKCSLLCHVSFFSCHHDSSLCHSPIRLPLSFGHWKTVLPQYPQNRLFLHLRILYLPCSLFYSSIGRSANSP